MILLPAIDLIGGKPVRLYQGDYTKSETVAVSALETVKAFEAAGAEYIHMVDLDGAKSGKRMNAELIAECANSVSCPIEVGGGIRTMDDIRWYLEHGISRVILGTAAVNDEELLKQALSEYGEKIAVGLDCRNGYVSLNGWLEDSEVYYLDLARHLEELGVQDLILTDIAKDGTLNGPNLEMLKELSKHVRCNITASGGIRDMQDIHALMKLDLYGAIAGKAVYTGSIDLEDAVRITKEAV